MKRLFFLLLTFISITASAQWTTLTQNTLQRKIVGTDTSYRSSTGGDFVYWYNKWKVDQVLAGGSFIRANPVAYQNASAWINGIIFGSNGGSSILGNTAMEYKSSTGGHVFTNSAGTILARFGDANNSDINQINIGLKLGFTPALETTPTRVLTMDPITGLIKYATPASIGGGAGSSYTFNNGLNNTVGVVGLGGDAIWEYPSYLQFKSNVSGGDYNLLTLSTNRFDLTTVSGSTRNKILSDYQGLNMSVFDTSDNQLGFVLNNQTLGKGRFYDDIFKTGILYAGKYRTNLTNRSIVDKEYVDSVANAGSGNGNYIFANPTTPQNASILLGSGGAYTNQISEGAMFPIMGNVGTEYSYNGLRHFASANGQNHTNQIIFGNDSIAVKTDFFKINNGVGTPGIYNYFDPFFGNAMFTPNLYGGTNEVRSGQNYSVLTSSGDFGYGFGDNSILIGNGEILIQDDAKFTGMSYSKKYRNALTNRWIPDKEYVDSVANVGGGGGSPVYASNGLTKVGDTVKLGGDYDGTILIGNLGAKPTILLDGDPNSATGTGVIQGTNYQNNVNGRSYTVGGSYLDIYGNLTGNAQAYLSVYDQNLLKENRFLVSTERPAYYLDSLFKKGIDYKGINFGNFTDSTLVPKKYVVDLIASGGASAINANNGLTKTGNNIVLGGALTGTTVIGSLEGYKVGIGLIPNYAVAIAAGEDAANLSNLEIRAEKALLSHDNAGVTSSISLQNAGILVEDLINHRGMGDAANYAGNKTPNSYVTKRMLDSVATAASSGAAIGANPTATAGVTAVNGSAPTFMRSDAAPKVDSLAFRTVANSPTLAGLQSKFNLYFTNAAATAALALKANLAGGNTYTGLQAINGQLSVSQLLAGASIDSLVVHDNTSDKFKLIDPTFNISARLKGVGTVADPLDLNTVTVPFGGTGATNLSGLIKGNGAAAFTAAVAGTDYVSPLTNVAGFPLSGNITLGSLTATNGSLTLSGAYNGSAARTIGLNLANANTFTAAQSGPTPAAKNSTTNYATTAFVGKQFTATASGNGASLSIVIAHGVSGITTASSVIVGANNAAASGINWYSIDATNVTINYTVAPASGTNNLLYSISIK